MSPPTRRELLKTTGGVAGLSVAGGLSGCLGLFGGSGGGSIDEDSTAKDVPNRAGALCHVDFAALLQADELLTATDDALAERDTAAPDSVEAALDRLEETYNLDPRGMNGATAFVGEDIVSTPDGVTPRPAYWGVVGYTDWEPAAMRESFRNAAPSRVTESTYDGNTVLQIGGETLSVLGEDKVVFGTRPAVEETIDVAAGNASGVTGELRRAFDTASGGYAQFGVNLDMVALGTQLLGSQAVDAIPFSSIQHSYGSLFDDGSERGVRLVVKLGSATKAEQLAAQIDSFVGIAKAQGVNSRLLSRYEPAIQGIETTTDGKILTATYRVSKASFDDVAAQLLADFLLGIRTT
jgi:hypothetical protein